MKAALLGVVGLGVIALLPSSKTIDMEGDFISLQSCLYYVQKDSKSTLKIVNDTPDEVTGYINVNNKFFSCQKQVTGTKGTYYKGRYEVDKS